jgi:hypothetical protein
MWKMAISEQTILDALHRIPADRWGEVLRATEALAGEPTATVTAAEVARSGLIGTWADRDDLGDSREFARRLRREAETRRSER